MELWALLGEWFAAMAVGGGRLADAAGFASPFCRAGHRVGAGTEGLLDVIEDRHQRRATILTSQLPIDKAHMFVQTCAMRRRNVTGSGLVCGAAEPAGGGA